MCVFDLHWRYRATSFHHFHHYHHSDIFWYILISDKASEFNPWMYGDECNYDFDPSEYWSEYSTARETTKALMTLIRLDLWLRYMTIEEARTFYAVGNRWKQMEQVCEHGITASMRQAAKMYYGEGSALASGKLNASHWHGLQGESGSESGWMAKTVVLLWRPRWRLRTPWLATEADWLTCLLSAAKSKVQTALTLRCLEKCLEIPSKARKSWRQLKIADECFWCSTLMVSMFRAVLGLFQGLNAVSGVDDVEDLLDPSWSLSWSLSWRISVCLSA